MKSFLRLRTIAVILISVLWSPVSIAAVNKGGDGIAIKGYDAVAYFKQNKAVSGVKEYSAEWMNATWYFSNADHKKSFLGNPEKFAPQYGGFCAYAVAQGSTADVDPTAFNVVNGKLYLNYNAKVQFAWNRNRVDYIQKADAHWPRLSGK